MRATWRGATLLASAAATVLTWPDLAAGQPAPLARPPRLITEVCWADRWQALECVAVDQLRRLLSRAELERLMTKLEELLEGSGVDAAHDALVECGSKPRPAVASVAPGTAPAPRTRTRGSAELKRLSARISGCADRVAEVLTGRGRVKDGGRQYWIDDTVAQVDAELAACRDSGDPRIAQGNERKVKGVMDISPQPPPAATTPDPSTEGSALLVKTKHGAGSSSGGGSAGSAGGPASTGGAATTGGSTSTSGEASTGGSTSTTGGSSGSRPKEPTPSGIRRGTTSPCPAGTDCAPTCAERQARWERFKESCEQSDWQAYPCVDFLRKANGCVDAALINPGPDGDLTCPVQSRITPAERMRTAWELNCKRRQMFVTPVPGGGDLCKRPDEPMPARVDICHDPRAMPADDQCTRPAGGSGIDQPVPRPKPDPRRPGLAPPPG
jgi:hypothetical protein